MREPREGDPSAQVQDGVEVHPLTPERWGDLVALFGRSGAYWGCWDMYWRLPSKEFDASSRAKANQQALHGLVEGGAVPGLLAYRAGRPVGWCALGPRPDFPRLERSRHFRPVDNRPAWAIVCFFVHRDHRRQGVAEQLLRAAVRYAAARGASLIEGYPVSDTAELPAYAAYCGTTSLFRAAGFEQVALTSARSGGVPRAIMRLELLQGLAEQPVRR